MYLFIYISIYIYICIYIYNKLTDQNYNFHFEVPPRDIHIIKIDYRDGILHHFSRRVILEGSYFYILHVKIKNRGSPQHKSHQHPRNL